MAFVALIEMALVAGLGWLVITQLLLPAFRGEPILPMFWAHRNKLEAEKNKLVTLLEEEAMQRAVNDLRERLRKSQDKGGNHAAPNTEEKE